MIVYFITMYIISLLLGYGLALTQATLMIGRSLNDTDSKTGYQDAITPPWSTNLAITTYLIALAGIVYGFIKYGWLAGIGIIIGLFCLQALNRVFFLPKKDSEHFRRLIIRSMMRRYANYLRDGDKLRAFLMQELLEKLGIPVPEFISRHLEEARRIKGEVNDKKA